jgi:peptide/nickel transport system permease protein
VLPHALPATLVVISLNAASIVILEASLAFVGLGDPHVMSWGYLAHNAHHFMRSGWWLTVFPGVAIALAVLGFTLLADSLSDLLDPRRCA